MEQEVASWKGRTMTMTTNEQWESLAQDHELAYFRADVCLGSPQSYSLEEKKQICAEMEASTAEIDAAMRRDFQSLPLEAQVRMLNLLDKADPERFSWWIEVLVGKMPDTPPEE